MSREYALSLRHLVECLDKFSSECAEQKPRFIERLDLSSSECTDSERPEQKPRSAFSPGGYLHEAVEKLRKTCPDNKLPEKVMAGWRSLCESSSRIRAYDPCKPTRHSASSEIHTVVFELYLDECLYTLTRHGLPVFVLPEEDPDGPTAIRLEHSLEDVAERVSRAGAKDKHLVETVVQWLNEGQVGKDSKAFAKLSIAARDELKFRKLATELIPGYNDSKDNAKVAALVCKHCQLQPSEFKSLSASDRIPFIGLAIRAVESSWVGDGQENPQQKQPDTPDISEGSSEPKPVINTPGDLYNACHRGVNVITLSPIPGKSSLAGQELARQDRLWVLVRDRYPDLSFSQGYLRAFVDVATQQEYDVQRVRRMDWDEFCNTLEGIEPRVIPSVSLEDSRENGADSDNYINANDPRDEWIYELCCEIVPYRTIISQLKTQTDSWERIDTIPGIKAAANRYAERHGLTPIPKRQRGRPKK